MKMNKLQEMDNLSRIEDEMTRVGGMLEIYLFSSDAFWREKDKT